MTSENIETRLNKFLALELGISRREADDLIESGSISINGTPATLGARIVETDVVKHDANIITSKTNFIYLLLNKPVGYVCSRRSQGDSPTIYDLLPEEYHALKTAGRLDKDSSGLLLLTNDGDFAYKMTHPKFHKQKEYVVSLDKELAPLHQQVISDHGVQLEDGPSRLLLERISDTSRKDWRVLMHEGRNRQIRRTFMSLGYDVESLHRTRFGNYSLGDIKLGSFISTNIS